VAAPHPLTPLHSLTQALIFANGDPNDGPLVRQVLASAGDAWVIAADGGARQAAFFGLHPHTVIGDLDSLEPAEVAALEAAGVQVHAAPPEKDETDLELALLYAAGQGARWIRIIGGIGDRIDQTLGNLYLMALPALRGVDVRLVARNQQAWLLHPGANEIEGAPGDTLSLLPIGGDAVGIRTAGLYYPLHGETLGFGPARGMSNVLTAPSARVTLGAGVLLAIHTLGRA
jgi:thiamine pyrophosphokinase